MKGWSDGVRASSENPHCSACGTPLRGGMCPRCQGQGGLRAFRREIVLLLLAAAAGLPLYLFTRSMATENRARKTRAATYWYLRGEQQLQRRNTEQAILSFYRATLNDRSNLEYGMALAKALAAENQTGQARRALLRLRESAPEHAEINLELARLSARQGNVETAVRYYQNALYGIWPRGAVEPQRRAARMELIRFLLEHKERESALSELLLLSPELPKDSALYTEAGQLFLQVNDPRRALAHFQKAAELDRKNAAAVAGSGEATFALRDYSRARRYLEAALAQDAHLEEARQLLEITRFVLQRDPLRSGLPLDERRRRLLANLDYAAERLSICLQQPVAESDFSAADLQILRADALEWKSRLSLSNLRRNTELLADGVGRISQMVDAATQRCGETSSLDRALILIAERQENSDG